MSDKVKKDVVGKKDDNDTKPQINLTCNINLSDKVSVTTTNERTGAKT